MRRTFLFAALLLIISACCPQNGRPVGVFDSGTGGLTVLERILEQPELRSERFVYLADQANMPYGQYEARGKAEYLRELVVSDAEFLLDKNVKIIVIGCNTATAYGLKRVERRLEGTGVEVIGVINAGVEATLDRLESGSTAEGLPAGTIGVLATPGTISSGAYERTIIEECAARGIPGKYAVVNQSGYGFAESVDCEQDYANPALTEPRESYKGPVFGPEDFNLKKELIPVYNFDSAAVLRSEDGSLQLNDASCYARFNFVSLVERLRLSGVRAPLRAVILGCTHYPYQLATLQRCASELREYQDAGGRYPYRELISEDLVFIDPAEYTARQCAANLKERGQLRRCGRMSTKAYISVPAPGLEQSCLSADGGFTYEFKYGRQTVEGDTTFVRVPFSTTNIDSLTRARIKQNLPLCSAQLSY